MKKLLRSFAVASTLIATTAVQDATAQSYPDRRVTMLVVTAAGGPLDGIARVLAEQLQGRFGQPFIVENRPGAAGRIAIDALRAAPADGHTLLVAGGSITTLPVFVKGVNFDAQRDIAPVTISAEFSVVLAIPKDLPAATLREFIDYAKANPGKVNYASVDRQPTMLAMEGFQQVAGFRMTAIPFKTAAAYVQPLTRSEIHIATLTEAQAQPLLAAGSIRLLATLAERRLKAFPDVATSSELGYPDLRLPGWVAVLSNQGTPPAVIDRLYEGISTALKKPEVATRVDRFGAAILDLPPERSRQRIATETRFWAKVANDIGLKPE